jgi:hypothetical protein
VRTATNKADVEPSARWQHPGTESTSHRHGFAMCCPRRSPEISSVFQGRHQTTDKCRSDRHRKPMRISARCSAYHIPIRFGGIRPQAASGWSPGCSEMTASPMRNGRLPQYTRGLGWGSVLPSSMGRNGLWPKALSRRHGKVGTAAGAVRHIELLLLNGNDLRSPKLVSAWRVRA